MLLRLRDFIQKERVVSKEQLLRAFNVDEHALQPMLDWWLAACIIEPCNTPPACKSACFGCHQQTQYYQVVSNER